MRALENPRPSRNMGKSISTSRTRSSTGARRSPSSPASMRTETALPWSRNTSRLTAGSSGTESSRKRKAVASRCAWGMGLPLSAINRFLERLHTHTPVSIEETLAGFSDLAVAVDRALDRVDDPGLVEAGAGDLGLADVFRPRAAEQQLVVLGALPVDAEDA